MSGISPLAPTESIGGPDGAIGESEEIRRLRDNYPQAFTDFFGCSMPCIFKLGTEWPSREGSGPESQPYDREPRPVYLPHKVADWRSAGQDIWQHLNTLGTQWTFITPLACANAGEAEPFCPFVVIIGVKAHTLTFDVAVAIANFAKKVLHAAGFVAAEVAIVESEVTKLAGPGPPGPKLLSFDPLFDDVPELRKAFTPTLGNSIAPLKYPHFAGTGTLFFVYHGKRLLLTCAHVARPPSIYTNEGNTITNTSQVKEEIISPAGFEDYIKALKADMGRQIEAIKVYDRVLGRLGIPQPDEQEKVTEQRKKYLNLLDEAKKRIRQVNELLDEVKDRADIGKRIVGFVLHCEPIAVSYGPYGFTRDWALIELDDNMFDWDKFKGNKIYVGKSFLLILSLEADNFSFLFLSYS